MSTPDDTGQQVRPFAAVLAELAGGKVHTRLSEQLHELTTAVTATGKKGALTLSIEVKPLRPGDTKTLVVTAKTAVKAPEGDDAAPSSVFFAGRDGNLTRNDPDQLQLPLRAVADSGKASTA